MKHKDKELFVSKPKIQMINKNIINNTKRKKNEYLHDPRIMRSGLEQNFSSSSTASF